MCDAVQKIVFFSENMHIYGVMNDDCLRAGLYRIRTIAEPDHRNTMVLFALCRCFKTNFISF